MMHGTCEQFQASNAFAPRQEIQRIFFSPSKAIGALPQSTLWQLGADDYRHQWEIELGQEISGKVNLNAQQPVAPVMFPAIYS